MTPHLGVDLSIIVIVALATLSGCSPNHTELRPVLSACRFTDVIPEGRPLYSQYDADPAFARLHEIHKMLLAELTAAKYFDRGYSVYFVDVIDTFGRLSTAPPSAEFALASLVFYEPNQITEDSRARIRSAAKEVLLVELPENGSLRKLIEQTLQKGSMPLSPESRSARPHGVHDFDTRFIDGMVSGYSSERSKCVGFERLGAQYLYAFRVGLTYQEGAKEFAKIWEYVYDRPQLVKGWGEEMTKFFRKISMQLIASAETTLPMEDSPPSK